MSYKRDTTVSKGQQEFVIEMLSEPDGYERLQTIINNAKDKKYTNRIINLESEITNMTKNDTIDPIIKGRLINALLTNLYQTKMEDGLGTILYSRIKNGLDILPPSAMKQLSESNQAKISQLSENPQQIQSAKKRSLNEMRDNGLDTIIGVDNDVDKKFVDEIVKYSPEEKRRVLTTQMENPFTAEKELQILSETKRGGKKSRKGKRSRKRGASNKRIRSKSKRRK